MVTLSFMPWMAHGYVTKMTSVNGNEMEGFTDVGDGWVTAIAGGATALVAIAALLWNLRGQVVASAIAACGSLIACVAGYDLINGWYVPRPSVLGYLGYFPFEVRREPALWATAAAGLAIAIAGFTLLVAANRRQPFADDLNSRRETEGWA